MVSYFKEFLPHHIILHILSFLSARDVASIACVNRLIRDLIRVDKQNDKKRPGTGVLQYAHFDIFIFHGIVIEKESFGFMLDRHCGCKNEIFKDNFHRVRVENETALKNDFYYVSYGNKLPQFERLIDAPTFSFQKILYRTTLDKLEIWGDGIDDSDISIIFETLIKHANRKLRYNLKFLSLNYIDFQLCSPALFLNFLTLFPNLNGLKLNFCDNIPVTTLKFSKTIANKIEQYDLIEYFDCNCTWVQDFTINVLLKPPFPFTIAQIDLRKFRYENLIDFIRLWFTHPKTLLLKIEWLCAIRDYRLKYRYLIFLLTGLLGFQPEIEIPQIYHEKDQTVQYRESERRINIYHKDYVLHLETALH